MPTALITGITGQDGSFLAELLLSKGYQVYGLVRRLSMPNYERIAHILDGLVLLQGDLLDQSSLSRAIDLAEPDEIYNLAAMSHVGTSFEQPAGTAEYNGVGVVRLLEAIRLARAPIRFYQASTSELYGTAPAPQSETTPFHPRSPYATAKLFAHHSVVNYRESYGLHASCGILFNHESERRGLDFVTKKIARGLARIRYGLQEKITLGNLDAARDWGFAGDYVEAMWLMLQQPEPDDYVIATGKAHSVKQFIHAASPYANINDWTQFVEIDERFKRPADVPLLCGDASKAARVLGWQPRVSFEQLVARMITYELELLNHETEHSSPAAAGRYRVHSLQAV